MSPPDRPPLYAHQVAALAAARDRTAFALLMEQRTGKTRVAIERLAAGYATGDVDALVVLAPNGVHLSWIDDELPAWAAFPYRAHAWRSSRSSSQELRDELTTLADWTDGVAVLAMNIEALVSDRAFKVISWFLSRRRALLVIDESQTISSPGAKRTKRALALSPRASVRMILTGTPATESPFQLYSQFKFLDPAILGHPTFATFKNRYGDWGRGYNRAQGREFPQLLGYRNVEELTRKLATVSFRVRRADCADLPPKVYRRARFELSSEVRRIYDELRATYRAELVDGLAVSAANVLTRWVRLQQVASNFWPGLSAVEECRACAGEGCEVCEFLGLAEVELPARTIDPVFPHARLAALGAVLEAEPGPFVVWCKFHRDVDDVVRYLGRGRAVQADGRVPARERRELLRGFNLPGSPHDVVVTTTGAAGRGTRLDRARTVVYYSNDFSLERRLQSEDRAESVEPGFDRGTGVIDLVAEDTVDERIVAAHRSKARLAATLVGDPEPFD